MKKGYNKKLAKEWIDWVEAPDPEGTREKEIFPYIRKWLKEFDLKTIVDIGCGQGSCSALLPENTKYVGIDSSQTLIDRAKELFTSPNRESLVGDAYDLPLENDSYDAVMSIWVWSHLKDLRKAAKEMYRILKKGGRFLVITANPATYEERKTFYKEYTIDEKENKLIGTFDLGGGKTLTDTTLYFHSRKDILEAIKTAGFKIETIGKMGEAETSDKGLYIVVEGRK
jgi:ubiquinone/menaquinone biosynthesis C-methylase UbiE